MLKSLLITTGVSLALYLSGFFILFVPLPFVFFAFRHGSFFQAVSFLVALLILFTLYSVSDVPSGFLPFSSLYPHLHSGQVTGLGILYFFYYGWMASVLTLFSRKSLALEKSFLMILASMVVPLILAAFFSNWQGIHWVAEIRETLRFWIHRMVEVQEKSGFEGEQLLFMKENGNEIVEQIISILPALFINFSMTVIGLNVLFLRRWVSQEKAFASWGDFSLWRLNERVIFLPIFIGAFFFLNLYILQTPLIEVVLINGLLVLAFVYFLQGLAIASFFFKKKLSPMVRVIAYLSIFLFMQLVGIFIVIAGLFDFWFDFRKIKRVTQT